MITLNEEINTKIVGVTFKNEDGASRQEIIELCSEGDSLSLEHYYFKDEDAFKVVNCYGQALGNLKKELSAELAEKYDIGFIETADVEILNITGEDKGTLGVNICIKLEDFDSSIDIDNSVVTPPVFESVEPTEPVKVNSKDSHLVTNNSLKMLNQKHGVKALKMYAITFMILFIFSIMCTLFVLIFSFPFALIFAVISFISFKLSRLYKKAANYSE